MRMLSGHGLSSETWYVANLSTRFDCSRGLAVARASFSPPARHAVAARTRARRKRFGQAWPPHHSKPSAGAVWPTMGDWHADEVCWTGPTGFASGPPTCRMANRQQPLDPWCPTVSWYGCLETEHIAKDSVLGPTTGGHENSQFVYPRDHWPFGTLES